MKVAEVRECLKKYNMKEKDGIIIELYKRIPKKVKEEYEIDKYLNNINEEKKPKDKETVQDIMTLKAEIDYFLSCANQGLYASPNRIIPKKERSGWRFKVKKFIKDLNTFDPNTNEGILATNMLGAIFKILSYGSCSLTFTNWETFRAVGISQDNFLDMIMQRKFAGAYSKDDLSFIVNLLKVDKDPYGWSDAFYGFFIDNLKDKVMLEDAISLLDEEIQNTKVKLKENEKKHYYTGEYNCKELINDFSETILKIYIKLDKTDLGIKYFQTNYIESQREIKEYVLLEILKDYELYSEYIKEYESKMNKIKFRESLQIDYKRIKREYDE